MLAALEEYRASRSITETGFFGGGPDIPFFVVFFDVVSDVVFGGSEMVLERFWGSQNGPQIQFFRSWVCFFCMTFLRTVSDRFFIDF